MKQAIRFYDTGNGLLQTLPFPLPEKRYRNFAIEHERCKAGKKLTVVSMRNAIFMGLKPASVTLAADTIIHRLTVRRKGCKGTWMTSYPQEVEQMERQTKHFRGRVIVGGLGLGLVAAILAKNKAVKQIIVLEKSASVCKMVEKEVEQLSRPDCPVFVSCTDLYSALKAWKKAGIRFDYTFYDIWAPTGERVLTEHVIPLRRLSRGVVDQSHIECWNEEEMLGQIRMGLQTRILWGKRAFDGLMNFYNYHHKQVSGASWPFKCWLYEAKPSLKKAALRVEPFLAALKDPELWDAEWKQWDRPASAK